MKHEEFRIGEEFWCGDHKWRCTDIGTRVVVAIRLGPHEIAVATPGDKNPAELNIQHKITDDPSWLNGPPYAVAEHIFDEDSIECCSHTP